MGFNSAFKGLIHGTWRLRSLYIWDTFLVSWEHHVPSPIIVFFVSDALDLLTDLLRVLKIFFFNFSPLFALSWDIFYRPFMCLDLGQYWPHKFCYWHSVLLPPAKHSVSDVTISVFFPQTSSCKLVDGEILRHVQHLPFCPKLLTQHKDPF